MAFLKTPFSQLGLTVPISIFFFLNFEAFAQVTNVPVVLSVTDTIEVTSTVEGTTPSLLGYNLGHFMTSGDAADWFRYSGVKGARFYQRLRTTRINIARSIQG